jgi:hypothetical protein
MAKIRPLGQSTFDKKDGTQVTVTHVRIPGTGHNYLVLPAPLTDAQFLASSKSARSGVVFYTGGGSKPNIVNIEGASANTEFIVVGRHDGMVNYGTE